ncbi:hypothetical protein WMY93_020703 [Mugilogobius chulae]|uniref:Uncharacterized protein n=1 Tax=Mugilogobius chulae TaxID=88201 RepID=A0AAW0NFP9_9GOBI
MKCLLRSQSDVRVRGEERTRGERHSAFVEREQRKQRHLQADGGNSATCRQTEETAPPAGRRRKQRHLQADGGNAPPAGRRRKQRHLQADGGNSATCRPTEETAPPAGRRRNSATALQADGGNSATCRQTRNSAPADGFTGSDSSVQSLVVKT